MRKGPKKKAIVDSPSRGWSMAPLIKPGCKLKINLSKRLKIVKGDIVLIAVKNRFITHRIIKIYKNKDNKYLIKGDNKSKPNGIYQRKDILGKVEKIQYPNYYIDLTNRKNTISKYLFVYYSFLNMRAPFLLKTRYLYKIPVLKKLYRILVSH